MALPNTYKRVNSLISNGGQYINTGLLCTSDITFEFVARFTEINPNYTQKMIGATKDARNNSIGCLNGNYSLYWGRNGGTNNAGPADTEFHTFAYNNGNIYIDEEVRTTVSGAMSDTRNIWLFADSYDNRYAYMELQYCNFYSNGTLVREYIPVKRTSDGVLGLYDLVNDVFYTNSGSGSFYCSYEVEVEISPNNSGEVTGAGAYVEGSQVTLEATENSGYLFKNWTLKGFTKLDYIESTGTQYINTGVSCGNFSNYRMEFTIQTTAQEWGASRAFIFLDNNYNRWVIVEPSSISAYKVQLGGPSSEKSFNVDSTLNYHDFVLDFKNGYAKVDNNQQTMSVSTSTINGNIVLFGNNSSGSYVGASKTKLTNCKIYSNDVLIRNFIPVYRHSDGAIGLLDLCEMKFYGNSGTGTFIAGGLVDASLNIEFSNNPLSFIISNDISFIANFRANHQIIINYDYTLGTANYTWINDTQIKLSATPNASGQFKGWYINSVPISANEITTYTPLVNTIIEARFERAYDVTYDIYGDGTLSIIRGNDKNEVEISVIPDANNHFVKYEVYGLELSVNELTNQNGDIILTQTDQELSAVSYYDIPIEYTTTPLNLDLHRDIYIKVYFEEDDKFHLTVNTNLKYASVYESTNDVYEGESITIWARPFPDYYFVQWDDGSIENPRTIVMGASNKTLMAEYQRVTDTNGIYQYRCFVKDQLDLTAPPKAFLKVSTFTVKNDLMTNSNSTINVIEEPPEINNGDVLVVYDSKGQTLYTGVIKAIDKKRITCSQMQSFYKGTWIYNTNPQNTLEEEIALLLQDYADGKVYGCSYIDPLIAQRLGGITIDYVGTTAAKLPTDVDENGNLNYSEKDMESFIYELYENYGIIFDFEINIAGPNYVHIKVPSYEPIKVGNNIYAIKDMSPITTIEETNKLIIYNADKTYRTTFVATKSEIVENPQTIMDRFDITKTKVVFSDDDTSDLVANNLPDQMYNHKLTFTLIIKNFIYEFGDFNLGGQLDIYHDDDYYNSVLTGYEIKKNSNQNITEVDFICGKVRQKLTQLLTLGKV